MSRLPDYEQTLRLKVLETIQPVLNQEGLRPQEAEEIAAIIYGKCGRVPISSSVVIALSNEGLIQGFCATGGQLDDPGWRDIRTPKPGVSDVPTRYTDYVVRLPRYIRAPAGYSHPLELSAGKQRWSNRRDFNKWFLQRSMPQV